jgi:signal transduction histidine kinase
MKFSFEKPAWRIGFVVALLGLLVTLATLQYRWLGQVSVGERERMHASLITGAERFSQDFNREITRAFFSFQLGSEGPDRNISADIADRYDTWQKSAPNPGLIKDIYFISFDPQHRVTWQKFDVPTRHLIAAERPADCAELDQKLARSVKPEAAPEEGPPVTVDPVQSDIPLLLAPAILLSDQRIPGADDTDEVFSTAYVGVRLDKEIINNKLLPELAQRYFKGSNGLEYSLTVVKAGLPNDVVFSTGTPLTTAGSPAGDASVNIFDLQMEGGDNLHFRSARVPAPKGQGEGRTIFLTRTSRGTRTNLPTPDPGVPAAAPHGKNLVVRIFSKDVTTGFDLRKINSDTDQHWQLIARHRSGSLDTYITSTRRRSLGISFGVLVLLAVSVGFVLLAARRSQRLAQRQLEFVSSVSHEFRTPLAVICSAGENLADGIVHTPDQVEKYGSLIRGEGRRLTEMVEQVMEFAGVQSGRKTYHRAEVAVAELVDDALAASASLLESRDLTVDRSIAPDLPAVVVDPMAVRQSIQNLIGNAVKYGSDGGWIGVSARLVAGSKPEVEISVADRGMGIPESDRKHLFEPFYRGAEVVAAQIHGNGLGLSLVQRVVEAHQGRVTVESTPGKGSVFTIHLPVKAAPQGGLANRVLAPADR